MSVFLFPLHLQTKSIVVRFFYTRSVLHGNHYDVLNLSKSCSSKDIRDSFINLSKKFHPDINGNKDAHKKFLEINEAYKILSNPSSRHNYDLSLTHYRRVYATGDPYIHHRQPYTDPWKDPSFYHNRDKSQDKYYNDRPYYGIPGIPKLSNFTVSMICISIAAVVVFIQFLVLRKVLYYRIRESQRRSREAEEILRDIKSNAEKYTKQEQVELMRQRLMDRQKGNN